MGCNCGKNKATQSYLYTSPTGQKTTYTSEVQAQAAKIRDKNAGKGTGSYVSVPR